MTRRGVSQQETSHRVENKGPKRDCDLSTATLRLTYHKTGHAVKNTMPLSYSIAL